MICENERNIDFGAVGEEVLAVKIKTAFAPFCTFCFINIIAAFRGGMWFIDQPNPHSSNCENAENDL